MSNAILPTYPGLAWSVMKVPMWSTKIQKSVNGRELRAAYYQNPIWKFTMSFDVLRAKAALHELQDLMAFYNLRMGSFDSFLYKDLSDFTATAQQIGTGNGTNKKFRLLHSIGSWVEPIGYTDNITQVKVNGVVTTAYSADGESITLTSAPGSGAAVTWSGTFYYRVRFNNDSADFDNFMKDLWTLKKLELVSAR